MAGSEDCAVEGFGGAIGSSDASAAPHEEEALWLLWRQQGDIAARDVLALHHLGYARTLAAVHYSHRFNDEVEFDDYLQFASVGLMEAIDRFEPGRGAQFRTYAAHRMRGAILNGLEQQTEHRQQIAARRRSRLRQDQLRSLKSRDGDVAVRPSHTDDLFGYLAEVGVGVALACLLEDTGMVQVESGAAAGERDNPYCRLELAQLRARIRSLVAGLPEQQRRVVHCHYLQLQSFEDIAELMGLTKGRISQIHRHALSTMRVLMAPKASHFF